MRRRGVQLSMRFGAFNRRDLDVLVEALAPAPGQGAVPTRRYELWQSAVDARAHHAADRHGAARKAAA